MNNSKKRNTIQKTRILEYLMNVKTHPTAESVHKEVSKEIPNITLATVYRNLNSLAEEKKILRLEVNKEYHYDADITYHQHAVCDKCGKILDLFQQEISKYAMKKMDKKHFLPTYVNVIFNGICKDCQEV